MRIIRLLTLVLIVSFVFLVMLLDLTGSYQALGKSVGKTLHPVPAAVLHFK